MLCGNASAELINLTNDTVFNTITGGVGGQTTVPLSTYTDINNNQSRGAIVDGALLLQGGLGSGSGVYRRLYQLDSNTATKDGYNRVVTTNKNGSEFEEKIPNGFDPFLRINQLTAIDGYYTFSLDTNENNNAINKWDSVTEIQFYVGGSTDPVNLPITANALPQLGTKIWDLQANYINGSRNDIMLNDTLEAGSGDDNMYLLLPTYLFAGFDQNSFVYLYSSFGSLGITKPLGEVQFVGFDESGGFDEWATLTPTSGSTVVYTPPLAVPEPSGAALILVATVFGLLRRHR